MDKFGYICPQWKSYNGSFDKSMYHIDHIIELKNGGTNHISNLQALCPQCHAVKTNYEETKNIINNQKNKRNVSDKIKKQVAARQYFRCANSFPILKYKPYVIGTIISGFVYYIYDNLKVKTYK